MSGFILYTVYIKRTVSNITVRFLYQSLFLFLNGLLFPGTN